VAAAAAAAAAQWLSDAACSASVVVRCAVAAVLAK